MAKKELGLGDVVCLKSDKCLLMVVGLVKTKESTARCFWVHRGELKDGLFPLATLEVCKRSDDDQAEDKYKVGDVVRLKSDETNQQVMTIAFFLNKKRAECFWFHEGDQKVGNCPLCTLAHTQPAADGESIQPETEVGIECETEPAEAKTKKAKKAAKKKKPGATKPSSKRKSKPKRGNKDSAVRSKRARKAGATKKS